VVAGLIGAFSDAGAEEEAVGSAAESAEESELNFGAGASGFDESEFLTGAVSADVPEERVTSSAATGAVEVDLAACGVAADTAVQQSTTVERIKNPPQYCRPGEGTW